MGSWPIRGSQRSGLAQLAPVSQGPSKSHSKVERRIVLRRRRRQLFDVLPIQSHRQGDQGWRKRRLRALDVLLLRSECLQSLGRLSFGLLLLIDDEQAILGQGFSPVWIVWTEN